MKREKFNVWSSILTRPLEHWTLFERRRFSRGSGDIRSNHRSKGSNSVWLGKQILQVFVRTHALRCNCLFFRQFPGVVAAETNMFVRCVDRIWKNHVISSKQRIYLHDDSSSGMQGVVRQRVKVVWWTHISHIKRDSPRCYLWRCDDLWGEIWLGAFPTSPASEEWLRC